MNQRLFSIHKDLRSTLAYYERNANQKISLNLLDQAVLFSRIIALSEGLQLIKKASEMYEWNINMLDVLYTWRGGCIIRSSLLDMYIHAYKDQNPNETSIELTSINEALKNNYLAIDAIVSQGHHNFVPTPCMSAALEHFKTMHTSHLPINLIQAQRDYFGAHTYKSILEPEKSIHTNWKS
jgi:6-phosphogluconate dehydrogenase